jgi:hypothetical protein
MKAPAGGIKPGRLSVRVYHAATMVDKQRYH